MIPSTTPSTLPTGFHQTGGIAARTFATLCFVACVVWALLPLEPASLDVPEIVQDSGEAPAAAPAALDLAAFNAPLWVAPPPPPPPTKVAEVPPPEPALPPLQWQLLAIVREGAAYKALVYDPESDKLLVLGEGDQSGARRIARVSPTSLEVREGNGVRKLALRDKEGVRP